MKLLGTVKVMLLVLKLSLVLLFERRWKLVLFLGRFLQACFQMSKNFLSHLIHVWIYSTTDVFSSSVRKACGEREVAQELSCWGVVADKCQLLLLLAIAWMTMALETGSVIIFDLQTASKFFKILVKMGVR